MNRTERLQDWIDTLDSVQKSRIILEILDYAIDSEYVNFYDDSKAPYFDATGDRLDEL